MSVIRGLLTAAAACVLLAACGSAPEAIDIALHTLDADDIGPDAENH